MIHIARALRRTLYVLTVTPLTVTLPFVAPVQADTYTVTTSAMRGSGSLEQAILDANANPGLDRIEFNILPNIVGAPHTLYVPAGGLPIITDPVVIDGYTEPGSSEATATQPAILQVVLDGSGAGGSTGLQFETDNSEVRGFAIRDFVLHGIALAGDSNVVKGCHIGTDESGTVAAPNSTSGIRIDGTGNEIGGVNPTERNVLSGNGSYGVDVDGDSNRIIGNYIGSDASGLLALGNGLGGVRVAGSDNYIGDAVSGAGNVISGNSLSGVVVMSWANANRIMGNFIGPDVTGTMSLINQVGITLYGNFNIIGGQTPEARNVISGNVFEGIDVFADGNIIQGNYIGTDIAGGSSLGNFAGIRLHGDFNLVGGFTSEAGNVISGNFDEGIAIRTTSDQGDLSHGNSIQSNAIGTDPSKTQRLGNGGPGIVIDGGTLNVIGWTAAQGANVISANETHGIVLGTDTAIDETTNNLALVNYIGTNETALDLGNQGSGVYIDGGENNWIGSLVDSNAIAFNDANGITVVDGVGNAFLANSIYQNQGQGIDLGNDGPTLNDTNDFDNGPNNLQNKVTNLTARLVGGDLVIDADLNSTPETEFRVEVFSNGGCRLFPGPIGSARNFIGYQLVRTDSSGDAVVSMVLPASPLTIRNGVRTTVTENVNSSIPRSTSELSLCRKITH